jgi:carotenoid 1,2-hydratase
VGFDEVTSPFPRLGARRLEGEIVLRRADAAPPGGRGAHVEPVALDAEGAHRWWPIMPSARVSVDVPALGLRWSGQGYHDANSGDHPLGRAFRSWSWGRFDAGGRTIITYDAERRDGTRLEVAQALGPGGMVPLGTTLRRRPVGRTAWGLPIEARADAEGRAPTRRHTLEDGPFYARHIVETSLQGVRAAGVTETLSLDRLGASWVRTLLPFRMRRA